MRKVIPLLVALGAASMANAQTLFDNINGYTAWNGTSAWTVRGSALSPSQSVAQQFTATGSGTVGTIELSIQKQVGSATDSGIVSLFTDSGSNTLGTLLSNQSFTGAPAWNSTSLLSVAATPGVTLTASTKYWVVVRADANSDLGWRITPNFSNGWGAGQSTAASPWVYNFDKVAGIKITAPVPEPVTVTAFGLGVLGLARRRKR